MNYIEGVGGEVSLGELSESLSLFDKSRIRWLVNKLIQRQYVTEIFPPPIFDQQLDIWHRPNTTDLSIAKAARRYCKLNVTDEDVLIDIGAHIGAVARHYAKYTPATVVAIEPEPDNFKVLEKNIEATGATLIRAALIEDEQLSASLFISGGSINRGLATLIPRQSSFSIDVPAISFTSILSRFNPTVIKMDINGGEYGLLETFKLLPRSIRCLMIELHRLVPEHYKLFQFFITWLQKEFVFQHQPIWRF